MNIYKITFLLLLMVMNGLSLQGQTSYKIQDFSDKYSAELSIDSGYENQVFRKGEISIYDKAEGKKLFTIASDEFAFDLDENDEVETNIVELPYGKQSILIYADFNFDTLKDLAVMDGHKSCYHGPSYQIYLSTAKGLQHSPEFTRLAQEYCGMFLVDRDSQRISTMKKSGCCWHEFSSFTVSNNIPVAQQIVSAGIHQNGLLEEVTTITRSGDTMIEKKSLYLSPSADLNKVYGMGFKNKKHMDIYRVFRSEDRLMYVFTDSEGSIELFYEGDFDYDKSANKLSFTNIDTKYTIYPGGIWVQTPSRKVNLKATSVDKGTDLSSLSDLRLKNLKVH